MFIKELAVGVAKAATKKGGRGYRAAKRLKNGHASLVDIMGLVR
jgi:hypothetical protein